MKASFGMRAFFLTTGGVLVLYALAVMASVRFSAGQVACFIIAAPLLIWGIFWNPLAAWSCAGAGKVILFLTRAAYAIGLTAIAIFVSLMFIAAAAPPGPGADAVIVLGAGLNGEDVSIALARRLDAAYAYLAANPQTVCVLSGGQGEDEPIAEAEAMRRYMEARGIDPARLIPESRSANTAENIAYSKELLAGYGEDVRVVVATNDFHVLRGTLLAKGAGFKEAQGLSAPSEAYLLPQYCLREIIGLCKDGFWGRY